MPTIQTTLRMFEFIQGVISSTGEAPTIAEIGRRFNMTSAQSVHSHLKKMEERGWIKRSRKWRGIEIVEQDKAA